MSPSRYSLHVSRVPGTRADEDVPGRALGEADTSDRGVADGEQPESTRAVARATDQTVPELEDPTNTNRPVLFARRYNKVVRAVVASARCGTGGVRPHTGSRRYLTINGA